MNNKRFLKSHSAALFVASLGYKVVAHTKTLSLSSGCGCDDCGGWYDSIQHGFLVTASKQQLLSHGLVSSCGEDQKKYYAVTF